MSLLDLPEDSPDRQNRELVADCARRATNVMTHILSYWRFAKPATDCAPFGPAVVRSLDFVGSVSMAWPSIVREIRDMRSSAIFVEDELTQVLLNLIQNAAHAGAKRIIVSVTLMDHGGGPAPGASGVKSWSGQITIESRPREGTTVSMIIPANELDFSPQG